MMRYEIFEGNMPRVEKHMKKIARKCERYGCDFYYEIVGETFKEFEEGEEGCTPYKVTRRFVIVEVEGRAVVNGWRFIGSVERTANGNIFHKTVDIEIPERYYDAKPTCEHCNTKRARKYTYIIQNEKTGEFKQVGKTCLNDFTGGMDAKFIASYYAMFNKLAEFEAPGEGCSIGATYYPVIDIMSYAYAVTRIYGYVRSGAQNSTGETVKMFYGLDNGWFSRTYDAEYRKEIKAQMESVNFNVTDDDIKVAREIIDYINGVEENNNYLHNLKVLCAGDMVSRGNMNLLCSAIVCWDKELERRERKAKRDAENATLMQSEYLGNVGDRMTFEIEEWKALTSWETQWGITVLYRFIDVNGNVIIWKSSKHLDDEKEIAKLIGTVKEHKDFDGIKQTVVTRCKVA